MTGRRESTVCNKLVDGLKEGDKILRNYNAPGLLFGGALSLLYGETRRRKPPDLDILILSTSCGNHPQMREGTNFKREDFTYDWWVTHDPTQRPSNDDLWKKMFDPSFDIFFMGKPLVDPRNQVGLYWSASSKEGLSLASGLYVLSVELAKQIKAQELAYPLPTWEKRKLKKAFSENWEEEGYTLPYPILTERELTIHYHQPDDVIASYCKTYYRTESDPANQQ